MYLDGGDDGEILLPTRYVPEGAKVGQKIEVFLYLDQDEKLIATTLHPLAKVGEFAWLECAWTNEYGAFLNWGLMKDLFCPFREQKQRMQKGQRYYVYIMEDEKTHRLMATAKVERYQNICKKTVGIAIWATRVMPRKLPNALKYQRRYIKKQSATYTVAD